MNMFKFLWKLIKWIVIIFVAMFVAFLAYEIIVDPSKEAREECYATHGEMYCDSNGKLGDKEAIDKAIADEAAKNLAKAKADSLSIKTQLAEVKAKAIMDAEKSRISDIETNGRLMCRHTVKQSVKYPSKLDYDWGYDENLWENFNKDDASFPHRYVWNASGDMMNGFGNMVPFTVHCKIDLPASGNGRIVDFWIK
jgi:hypothetical protein